MYPGNKTGKKSRIREKKIRLKKKLETIKIGEVGSEYKNMKKELKQNLSAYSCTGDL